MDSENNVIVEYREVTKKFGNFTANDSISLKIYGNTIHSVIGENGAGKSTLMKILFGIYSQDGGELIVKGKPVKFKSPLEAISDNIGMLHQHFELIEDFTIFENVILGSEITNTGVIETKDTRKRIIDLIDKYKLGLDIDNKISEVSISEKQKVEILKLLFRNSEILIFDEPTSVLSPVEVDEFFKIIRMFKAEGKTIILITHKLNEIKELADRVSVLRKGKLVYEVNSNELDLEVLSREIIGPMEVTHLTDERAGTDYDSELLLSFDSVSVKKDNVLKLNGISFHVSSGEVYGICGVEGNGQSEIVDTIIGALKISAGSLKLNTGDVSLVPDDRIGKGMIKEFNIGENVLLREKNVTHFTKKNIKETSEKVISEYDVRLSDSLSPLASLSGGNQQKVIFGRETGLDNKMMVLVHPTRGVDINSSAFIYKIIIEQRNKNKGILLISSDLEEILKLSDRIGVIFKGRISQEYPKSDFTFSNDEDKHNFMVKVGKAMIGIE
ncbi:MAG: ABC transporter ATP-binding protein [Ignavibacteria bacterium]|nr:ABC transporter ATP-binding protein [Ignavibacteria bacterium]